MTHNHIFNNSQELFLARFVYNVSLIDANHWLIGRHNHNIKLVNFVKFRSLGIGRTCHSRQLLVHTEIVLESYRRKGLVLFLNFQTFLSLDCLMLAVTPAPARHKSPGKFVNDDHLTILDHVINITLEDGMGS